MLRTVEVLPVQLAKGSLLCFPLHGLGALANDEPGVVGHPVTLVNGAKGICLRAFICNKFYASARHLRRKDDAPSPNAGQAADVF